MRYEIQLTDAIDTLNLTQRVFANNSRGERFLMGDKFDSWRQDIESGLEHPEIKDSFPKQYVIELGKNSKELDEQ